mmetsp:Transcript_13008/g.24907  ORF Transcript_13008/g.24907 Transcript_13008/m.24907 type:complete len:97 (-) Transcript_13008:96-386(-)
MDCVGMCVVGCLVENDSLKTPMEQVSEEWLGQAIPLSRKGAKHHHVLGYGDDPGSVRPLQCEAVQHTALAYLTAMSPKCGEGSRSVVGSEICFPTT